MVLAGVFFEKPVKVLDGLTKRLPTAVPEVLFAHHIVTLVSTGMGVDWLPVMVAAAFGEIAGSWIAWAVTRFEASAVAAQGAGVLIGLALAAVAWGLSAKKRALGIETAGGSSRLADEPR